MPITTKKKGNKVYVYENGVHMWTENLDNPMRSWGATRFRKYALKSEIEKPKFELKKVSRIDDPKKYVYVVEELKPGIHISSFQSRKSAKNYIKRRSTRRARKSSRLGEVY